MPDAANPNHYGGDHVQRFIERFNLNFALGNVVKYVSRAGRKRGESKLTDLQKAAWYLGREIERTKKVANDE